MRANEGSLPKVRTALLLLGGMVGAGFAGVLTYLDTGRPIAGALAAATSLPAAIAFLDRIIQRPSPGHDPDSDRLPRPSHGDLPRRRDELDRPPDPYR